MSNSRSERFFRFLASFLRLGLTLLAAVILGLQANGYIINFHNLTLQKSSLVSIRYVDRPDQILINHEEVKSGRSQIIEQLSPGRHEVTLKRSGYHDWYSSFRVEPGQAQYYENVLLFFKEPILSDTRLIDPLYVSEADSRILVLGSELWLRLPDQLRLITRYSSPIDSAYMLNNKYIVLIVNNSVRVIEVNGENDLALIEDIDAKTIKAISDYEIELLLEDRVEVYKIR